MNIPPFLLERYFDKYEFEIPHLLCCSDCETWSVESILNMEPGSKEKFLSTKLHYTEASGSSELREVIANLYKDRDSSSVLTFTAAEEAIFVFMNSILNTGDEIIVQYPCYQSLFQIAQSNGVRVKLWKMSDEEGDWKLDFSKLYELTSKNTKAIIINFPHNPTGYVPTSSEFRELCEFTEKNKIILFSDEVYRDSHKHFQHSLPSAVDISDNSIALGSVSKAYGLPGLRTGWIVGGQKEILKKASYFKDYTSICSAAPSEFISRIALQNASTLTKRNAELCDRNLKLLSPFLERSPFFEKRTPISGPICFPKVNFSQSASKFCEELVEHGVLLLPGEVYGDEYQNYVRIGFGRENFPQALEELEKALNLMQS